MCTRHTVCVCAPATQGVRVRMHVCKRVCVRVHMHTRTCMSVRCTYIFMDLCMCAGMNTHLKDMRHYAAGEEMLVIVHCTSRKICTTAHEKHALQHTKNMQENAAGKEFAHDLRDLRELRDFS